jgi:hypothetical protein
LMRAIVAAPAGAGTVLRKSCRIFANINELVN